MKMEFVKR